MDGTPAIIQLVQLQVSLAPDASTENLKLLALELAPIAQDTEPHDDSE